MLTSSAKKVASSGQVTLFKIVGMNITHSGLWHYNSVQNPNIQQLHLPLHSHVFFLKTSFHNFIHL